ncbi:MAG: hypothetical protein DME79_04720 [Verrucomicrobia bacterium]|nr:MAG: hypothetical protein DME79_04720 [Verrucomicrobiota bacterium]
MPTRWVKFIFAIFLLPICAILTQTFFTAFARATVTQRLWAGEEFWFFSLGFSDTNLLMRSGFG